MTREVVITKNVKIGGKNPLVVIAGPCVIESEEKTLALAEQLKSITQQLDIPFIFKSSYDKANRTSLNSYRGPGLRKGLEILAKVKTQVKVPIISDVHQLKEIDEAKEVLDIIQIPAFLCRQTDLLVKAGNTGKPVNIKKGQFLSPYEIAPLTQKITACHNENILITERGTTFGYNNLVVDMRSLVIMRQYGFPIIFDATHSVQLPGGKGTASGGQSEFIPYLAMAATAVGIDGIYIEVHDKPEEALCDGPNSLKISELPSLLKKIQKISRITQKGNGK